MNYKVKLTCSLLSMASVMALGSLQDSSLASSNNATNEPDSARIVSYENERSDDEIIIIYGSKDPHTLDERSFGSSDFIDDPRLVMSSNDKIRLTNPEHSWAILELSRKDQVFDPKVFAKGISSETTIYSFPCSLETGNAFIAWSLKARIVGKGESVAKASSSVNPNGCTTVKVGIDEGIDGEGEEFKLSSKFTKSSQKIQGFSGNANPTKSLSRVPRKENFLVRTLEKQETTVVLARSTESESSLTVLDGKVKILNIKYPDGKLVDAGEKYIHNRKTGNGKIVAISRNDVYRSNPFKSFVNPSNWNKENSNAIRAYRESIPALGTFGIAGMRSLIPPSTVIGGRYCAATFTRSRCGENVTSSSGNINQSAQEGYRRLIEKELGDAGYTVLGSGDSFFSSGTSKKDARFLVAGSIVDAKFDSLESEHVFSSGSSWKTKGNVEILWEILDTKTGSIIFKEKSTGQAEVKGEKVLPALYEAASDSFNQALKKF